MSVPIRPEHLQEPSETVASRLYSHFFLHGTTALLGRRVPKSRKAEAQ